jgi:trans-2,3-dihydro-3-hydroxyanthranilate isomerase
VDVFAQSRYAGNQLAVITDAEDLTALEMQKIANEMHFSETTFILGRAKGGYDVRIFTPSTEVPFAGHPTLGTAYVIRNFIEQSNAMQVTLNLKVGEIRVTFEEQDSQKLVWMQQVPAKFGGLFEAAFFGKLLGLKPEDFDLRYPIQQVSTGLPFIIVPLRTLGAVKRAKVNQTLLYKRLNRCQAGILVFCPQTYNDENSLNVRVFVDFFGIPEDPATGSGNGCLAAYLSKYRYFGSENVDIRVEQGFEINRPSILYLKTKIKDEKTEVHVGGQVLLVAKGELIS